MTTVAYREVVAAEGTLPIMTTHATKRTSRCVMIKGLRRGDFIRLKPTAYAVTIIATQAFVPIVLRVTETNSEGTGRLARALVMTELMAHTARRDIAIA
jgi:hypothetical protein